MTYPQATQLILEKALSLDSGWAHASTDYIGSFIEDAYTHPKLPGVVLYHSHNGSHSHITLRTDDDLRLTVTSSDALSKHIEVVKRSIADAEALALENRIIEIASKLP